MTRIAVLAAVLAALLVAATAGAADEFAYVRSAPTGDGVVIVDSRPLDDCRAKTLAGARCLPSADFLGPDRRLPDARNLLWLLGTAGLYRAGVTFNYAKGSKVFANYAKGYRLPTTDELFDFTGIITDLKPEKSDTYEAGIVHAFGRRLQARATVYTMDVRDELFFDPTGGVFGLGANENLDKTRHTGVETGFTATVTDNISVFGNFTYTDVKFKSGPYDGNRIQLVPQYSASFGGDVRFLKSFLLAANANWIGEKYLDNDVQNDFDKMESYIVVNAKLSYTTATTAGCQTSRCPSRGCAERPPGPLPSSPGSRVRRGRVFPR